MPLYSNPITINFRNLLDPAVRQEFDHLAAQLNAILNQIVQPTPAGATVTNNLAVTGFEAGLGGSSGLTGGGLEIIQQALPQTFSQYFLSGRGHPQGVTAGPVGARYINTDTGRWYQKEGGGTTVWGWYPIFVPWRTDLMYWVARGGSSPNQRLVGVGVGNGGFGGTSASIGGPANNNPWWADGVQYLTGFTGASSGNATAYCFPSAAGQGEPISTSAQGSNLLPRVVPFDIAIELVTTPPINSTAAQPDNTLTSIRMWPLAIGGQLNSATPGNSDTLSTALSTLCPAGAYAFRFSTGASDAGFVPVIADNSGQTVGAALTGGPTPNTLYKFRIRRLNPTFPSSGLSEISAAFSINDGPEVVMRHGGTLTGFNTLLGINGIVTTLTTARKAIGWIRTRTHVGSNY